MDWGMGRAGRPHVSDIQGGSLSRVKPLFQKSSYEETLVLACREEIWPHAQLRLTSPLPILPIKYSD